MADVLAPQVPMALNPDVAPVPAPQLGLGQPSDINDLVSKANNPASAPDFFAPSDAEAVFQQVKSQLDMNQPGTPELVREKMALEVTQRHMNAKQAQDAAAFEQRSQQQVVADANAAQKQALGLAAPPVPKGVTPTQADELQFAPAPATADKTTSSAIPATSEIEKAYSLQQRGLQAAADAGAGMVAAEAGAAKEAQAQLAESEKRMVALRNETAAKVQESTARLQKMAADIDTNATKVNPNQFWETKDVGQKILAGIAIALGGTGGALTGRGDNKALEIINRAVDQDIEAQKENIRNQQQKTQTKMAIEQNTLSSLNQQFGNEMQAEAALRVLNLQKVENQLKIMSAPYKTQELQAKAMDLSGKLALMRADALSKFQGFGAQDAILNRLAKGEDISDVSPAQRAALPKEVVEAVVPGWGIAANKERASKFSEYIAEAEPALVNAREVLSLAKNRGSWAKLSPTQRAELESRSTILAGQLRLPITGPGALTDSEYQRLRETLGNPNKLMSLNSVELKKLETVINWLDQSIKTRAKQAGLPMKKELQTVDTSGTQPRKK